MSEIGDQLRESVLSLVGDARDGLIAAEDVLQQAEEHLGDVTLFPAGPLLRLGDAAAERLEQAPAVAVDLTLRLVSSGVPGVRAFAAAVIHRLARYQPGIWAQTVQHLVRDDQWEVRDLAARCFDNAESGVGAAEFHLGYVTDLIRDWVHDEDYQLRRAATQALIGYAAQHAEFRPQLLELLDPLAEDDLEYVRHSYVLALTALGRADPALVMDHIESALDTLTELSRDTYRLVLEHRWTGRLPDRRKELMARL